MMNVVIKNLNRRFGKTIALDNVSFEFDKGQIFGFVGPNGAGKTTTLRIMATLDEPDSGDIFLSGKSLTQYPENARERIGFVPDNLPEDTDISVHEFLDFFARAYNLKGQDRISRIEGVEEFTGLTGILDKKINALSKGMKQRVSLARALVHGPDVLLMDEPAAGLDPRARIELRELLKVLSSQGKAILISSHILTELTEICDGVVIIEQGKILETGTIHNVMNRHVPKQAFIIRSLDSNEELRKALMITPGISNVRIAGDEIYAEIEGDDSRGASLLADLINKGFRILEYRRHTQDLEDIFMQITEGKLQ